MQIVFLVIAAVILGSAVLVVTARNLVHAALWLIVSLFGVAVLYAFLNAGFLAAVQVVVYIGAIAILFVLVVMLSPAVPKGKVVQHNPGWWLSALLSVLLFGGLVWMLSLWQGFSSGLPAVADANQLLTQLGTELVSPNAYVLPFELASVLLVAAMIGAIWVAWERK
jgi:NADH-quinone oxidoreductase subunit J